MPPRGVGSWAESVTTNNRFQSAGRHSIKNTEFKLLNCLGWDMEISSAILRSIRIIGFADYLMNGEMTGNGKPAPDDTYYPPTPHFVRNRCCPLCGNRLVIPIRVDGRATGRTIWMCATDGCMVNQNQFVNKTEYHPSNAGGEQ